MPDNCEALKPCPFCGGSAELAAGITGFYVSCRDCGAASGQQENPDHALAGESWNRRASTPAPKECGCQLKPFYHKPTPDCIPGKPAPSSESEALSAEEKGAVECCSKEYANCSCDSLGGNHLGIVLALVRRLLSTRPDSEAVRKAKEAVIVWVRMMPLAPMMLHTIDRQAQEELSELIKRRAALEAALDATPKPGTEAA